MPFIKNIIHLWLMHATGLLSVCHQYIILVIKDLTCWINKYNGVKHQVHMTNARCIWSSHYYYGNLVLHNSLAQKAWIRSVGCRAYLLCMTLLPPTHYTLHFTNCGMQTEVGMLHYTMCRCHWQFNMQGTCLSQVFPAHETTVLSAQ